MRLPGLLPDAPAHDIIMDVTTIRQALLVLAASLAFGPGPLRGERQRHDLKWSELGARQEDSDGAA